MPIGGLLPAATIFNGFFSFAAATGADYRAGIAVLFAVAAPDLFRVAANTRETLTARHW
jgi:hypothetical protein